MLLPWVLAAATIIILGAELCMWHLFRRRIDGLHLHLAIPPYKRFFTFARIRLFVIAHTILMLSITDLSLLLLW